MSKKSRLRALKAKQLEEQKRLEEEELKEKEKAKSGARSRSAGKYIKSAKRKEKAVFIILKIIMLIPYAVNCIFFGLVTVLAIFSNGINDIKRSVAYEILIAIALITVGLVFAFLRKYILGFIFCGPGSGLFLKVGAGFVSKIQYYMANYHVDPANKNMDIKYMLYFYPAAIITVISLILMALMIAGKAIDRKKEKDRYNNQPVKSIID